MSLYTVVPNAVGAVGLVLIARRSDRTGERRKHFACCTIGGGLALAALLVASGAALMVGVKGEGARRGAASAGN
ncbi:hypothetical protein BCEN4_150048 [Burkholderia cenocepacia]|nr:hypothetical protein ABW54_06860 [Burkholderia cenocepacia]CAD9219686.1 hypothetical protein BCEN4_150048 [Burkholderia cenocepacia]